jgi:hypothetical protein
MSMIKRLFVVLPFVLFAAVLPAFSDSVAPLELYFFGPAGCMECEELKQSSLFPMEREFGERISIQYHDIYNDSSYVLMLNMRSRLGVQTTSSQLLFFPDTALYGLESIRANVRALVDERLNNPHRYRMSMDAEMPDSVRRQELMQEQFNSLVLGALIAAAFVDSINPCAFAAMIFLVSFLAAQKRKRKEIVIIGIAFISTVFVTYLLLGLGLFKFLSFLDGIRWLSPVIKWTSVAFAGIIGIISFVDAFRFKKSGDTKDVKLQLPKKLKMLTHAIITKHMKGKRLVVGTVIAAFLVTLVDAVCTAEVYLPMIVIMVQNSSGMTLLTLLLYLILYNFIFVLPLIAIMVAAYYGVTWNKLASMTQKKLMLIKILFGTVMIALALVLAFAMS